MPVDKLKTSSVKEVLQKGKSDDFELPIAPPPPPSRQEWSSTDASKVTEEPVQIYDSCLVDSCSAAVEQLPSGKIDISQGTSAANCLKPSKTKSLNAKDNDATVPEMPASTIDDHPLVAALIVFLLIFSTVFIGAMSIVEPLCGIILLAIYWMGYDFFKKRRIRKELRQQNPQKSSNAS